jgi:hypothetical protein
MASPVERIFPPLSVGLGGSRIYSAPPPLYVTGEDYVRAIAVSVLGGLSVQIHARLVTTDGATVAHGWSLPTIADRLPAAREFHAGVGSLLNVTAAMAKGQGVFGPTYIVVQVVRGRGDAATVLATILAGYVTDIQALGFPGSPITLSTEVAGFLRMLTGTAPAAGAEISEAVPSNARWRLLRLFAFFQTTAAAGNRIVRLKFVAGGAGSAFVTHTTVQGPSTTTFYTWAPGLALAYDAAGLAATAPLPHDPLLAASSTFQTDTFGLQAGDLWSTPQFAVREWFEVAGALTFV